MFTLNDADFQSIWQVLRKRKTRYVLQYGCFGWGMPVFLMGLIMSSVLMPERPITLHHIVTGTLIFCIAGCIVALLRYSSNEKRFIGLRPAGQ